MSAETTEIDPTDFISRRACAGYYDVSRKGTVAKDYPNATVTVTFFSRDEDAGFNGWVARANWSSDNYTDPLTTKREAVQSAYRMLTEYFNR